MATHKKIDIGEKCFVAFVILLTITGCSTSNCFNGTLVKFASIGKYTSAQADIINIDSLHMPTFAVTDSLAMFYDSHGTQYSYKVFNINTGKFIGGLCPTGHGSGEFVTVSPIKQLFVEDGDVKALLYAPNELKMVVCNIHKSIKNRKTVYEKQVSYLTNSESQRAYSRVYRINHDTLLTYIARTHIPGTHEITPSEYQVMTFSSDKLIDRLSVFQGMTENEQSVVVSEHFCSVSNAIKPDGAKIAEAMYYLPQINIIDIRTKKINGYLMEGEADYGIFDTDMRNVKRYYTRAVCDDNYIFALWSGEATKGRDIYNGCDELHVFDWNGKLLNKVKLGYFIQEIFLDVNNRKLYGSHIDKKEIYSYKIQDFLK